MLRNPGAFAWASSAWPVVVLVSGILLLFLLYALHPKSNWAMTWRDMLLREHTIIAIAIAIAGLSELLSSASTVFDYVWPAAIILTGGLFLFHAQHVTSEAAVKAVLQHLLLALTLIVAGLLNLIEITSKARFAAILWPVVLLIAAVQLLLYREPESAYEANVTHKGHGGH